MTTSSSNSNHANVRWDRDPVDNFENMSLIQFHQYSVRHLDILRESKLGSTSMKHPSWGDSHDPPGPCVPLLVGCTIAMGVAVGVGVAVGITQSSIAWGVASAVTMLVLEFVISFAWLLTYLSCYGKGLSSPPMPEWVERGGFVRNVRANLICRCFMTCCYNGHCDVWGCVMNSEATKALRHIQALNDGNGPNPGGVCWLGDSEFTFWHGLQHDMSQYHPELHFNAGFGGARIVDLQANVQRLCLDWNPSTVMVHASGNDYDYDNNLTAKEIPARLVKLFDTLASHASVQRIGYLLSSRRPIYADDKWDFMVRVHALTIQAIQEKSPQLHSKIKVFDLRSDLHELNHFVAVDRVHLNDTGHAEKSKVLVSKLQKTWPNPTSSLSCSSSTDPLQQTNEETLDIIVE